jgi:dienelactone hydrolase
MRIDRATRRAIAACAALLCGALLAPGGAGADRGSLYRGPGPRPGPDLLYAKPPRAPQLANRGVWRAAPILVSGATAYRRGEFLYQDFLYDDHGAAAERDPGDPRGSGHIFAQPNGSYTYPSARAYAENAADIVELRVKPLRRATAFRLTFNTMLDPSLVGWTLAIGSSPQPVRWPHGANVSGPARLFLTVHGRQAELRRAGDGKRVSPPPKVAISKRRRQVQVLIPHRAWNPGRSTVRLALGTGLWDSPADRYLTPAAARSATAPGGAGGLADPPAFFNVAFRGEEPLPFVTDPVATTRGPAWWRDAQQGAELAENDISPFFARVSFAKLRRGITDNRAVPKRGPINRILVSRFETAQGVDYGVVCFLGRDECTGPYQGRLQPYSIYVPRGPAPRRGWGTTLLMHSLAAAYNQYSGSANQRQFGERGPGSVVLTMEARGPDGSYDSYALADVFEVWADVARRYRLDPAWTVATGYSMGGFGTFDIAEQFPDLFARAQSTVGAQDPLIGGATNHQLASLRNIPVLMWNGVGDELVPPQSYLPAAQELDDLGYRYELDQFVPGEHLSLAINDEYGPAADFLGTARVNRNPHHVTYVVDPGEFERRLRVVADHAYWLSGLRARGAGYGTIDAISRGFGRADPPVSPTATGAGSLPGGSYLDPYPFTFQRKQWGAAPRRPRANRIVVEAEDIAAVTIHPRRARVDCGVRLDVTTDGPIRIRLSGCRRVVEAG